ncbi:hypothetical protein B0H11DRAFT_2331412 [Mycena galericulata]|nr:hypothetical protein B0H11DRAFT_2331412 [Mycena galericulata]
MLCLAVRGLVAALLLQHPGHPGSRPSRRAPPALDLAALPDSDPLNGAASHCVRHHRERGVARAPRRALHHRRHLSGDLFVELASYQVIMTNVPGMLGLTTPRDAFFTSLSNAPYASAAARRRTRVWHDCSVLAIYHDLFCKHTELVLLLRLHLCPLLLKALSDRPLFPFTLRCTRVVFLLEHGWPALLAALFVITATNLSDEHFVHQRAPRLTSLYHSYDAEAQTPRSAVWLTENPGLSTGPAQPRPPRVRYRGGAELTSKGAGMRAGLETLHQILEASGHTVVVVSETIFENRDPFFYTTALDTCLRLRLLPFAHPVRLCISTLGQFGRQADANIALTAAASLFWSVSYAIQSKRKNTEEEPEYNALWMILLLDVLWCTDVRLEVRNGAIQTLFRTMQLYGATLSQETWDQCMRKVTFPLLDSLTTEIWHFAITSLSRTPNTATTTPVPPEQAWDESKTLALQSIGSIFNAVAILHNFLASKIIHLDLRVGINAQCTRRGVSGLMMAP